MKIADLKNELTDLGFGALGELDSMVWRAAERSLKMIHTAHPEYRTSELAFFPEGERVLAKKILSRGEDITLNIEAGVLTLKLEGEGIYRACDGENTREIAFSSILTEVKLDFLHGGTLTLLGGGRYVAFDIIFRRALPTYLAEATTRCGDFYAIDLAKLYPDFLYLARRPGDKSMLDIPRLHTDGVGRILVPKCFSGVLNISYRKKPKMPDGSLGDEAELDISPELEPLLTLLCAYFIWLSDEPEKAKEYRARYEELSSEIKKRRGIENCTFYIDTNHWI